VSLKTGLNPRQNFSLNTGDANNYYITVRELNGKMIQVSKKTDMVNDEALRLINNRSNLEVNDILFSGTGTVGRTAIVSEPPINWNIKEGVYVIKPNISKIVPLFLMYLLGANVTSNRYKNKIVGSPVCSLPMADLRKLKIPVPLLEEQARIVSILDRFDTLCNDITAGLPAEIEARRKQYEYYRDKLLSFKELKVA
jgi:type I restriction enzyme S subunit